MKQELTGQIAFASGKTGDYDIWTLDVATSELTQVTTGKYWNDKPAWSPDGKWIAFVSNRTGLQDIFKIPAGGGDPIQLTNFERWCDSPRFSPDGSKIAFISNESGNNDIWIIDADGQNRRQITQHEASDTHVEWTADGRGLLWASDRDQQNIDIWHWDLATKQQSQLTNADGTDSDPVASPCGNFVVFVSDRAVDPSRSRDPFIDRDKDLWLMTIHGEFPVRLTENQGCDFCPSWSPDGRHILYTSGNDRTACHLRVIDIGSVIDAFETNEQQSIDRAASAIRSESISFDREPLQEEIDALRHTTFVTKWLPQKWIEGCYPPGYFGQERFPHWVDPAKQITAGPFPIVENSHTHDPIIGSPHA